MSNKNQIDPWSLRLMVYQNSLLNDQQWTLAFYPTNESHWELLITGNERDSPIVDIIDTSMEGACNRALIALEYFCHQHRLEFTGDLNGVDYRTFAQE